MPDVVIASLVPEVDGIPFLRPRSFAVWCRRIVELLPEDTCVCAWVGLDGVAPVLSGDDMEDLIERSGNTVITHACSGRAAMRWRQGVPVARFNTFTPLYVRAGTR